jgi:BirA family biotin operon repressor/biotin-[acetyl-CoA-carboxylase] ligase
VQTQGRGRFGRQWYSPFGENIYCSSRWILNCDLTKLSGLSLITSLAVLATINNIYPDPNIKIKWPNDILWGNKKLCGTLIEIMTESNSTIQVVIGIGLNVNSDSQNHIVLDKPWCSLYEISQQHYNRNLIIAQLIINLERYIKKFLNNTLGDFMEEWNGVDYLYGKHINVAQTDGSISGKAKGINQLGQLLLEDDNKTIHVLSSGDATLQGNQFL